MATATRQRPEIATPVLNKPMVCAKCQATHFAYQLTCKRCGEYLDKKHVQTEGSMNAVKLMVAAIGTVTAIAGVCMVLHIH